MEFKILESLLLGPQKGTSNFGKPLLHATMFFKFKSGIRWHRETLRIVTYF